MQSKSLIQDNLACYICGTTFNLHRHHIYFGPNRKLSEEDGCVVYLCAYHHTGGNGVHFNKKIDATLKARCEEAWLEKYGKTKEEFLRRYGKNYID
jgi:hypothetical protein